MTWYNDFRRMQEEELRAVSSRPAPRSEWSPPEQHWLEGLMVVLGLFTVILFIYLLLAIVGQPLGVDGNAGL